MIQHLYTYNGITMRTSSTVSPNKVKTWKALIFTQRRLGEYKKEEKLTLKNYSSNKHIKCFCVLGTVLCPVHSRIYNRITD